MILFAVNDAGPAKYMSYIMNCMNSNQYICIASNMSSKIFNISEIDYIYNNTNLNLLDIDLIITGTCLSDGIDKQWVETGKQNNINTISIIEHWSLYKKRFELNGKYYFPDIIFVNDKTAKEEAILDGIDENILSIVGNPVFENIVINEYSTEDKYSWKSELNIYENQKIITFISEEYKKDFPKGSLEYPGFDEFEVLDDIVNNLDTNMILLIKLHPAENKNKYNYLENSRNIIIVDKTDIDKLIVFSDIFIGMGSMLLLEASLFRNDVYSYRPNETIKFIGNKNNMTTHIKNKVELKKVFINDNTIQKKAIKNNFIGSTEKIIKFIQEHMI